MKLLDIRDGYIINACNNRNSWRTLIESCLVRERNPGEQEVSFLSTECRMKKVPKGKFSRRYGAWNFLILMKS